MEEYNKDWYKIDIEKVPDIKVAPPGPESLKYWERATKHLKGFSLPAKTMKIAYDHSNGMTLTDVDGNTYIDFSAGIGITNCGHNHPKIKEAMKKQIDKMINCHDYVTVKKVELLEKLAEITPEGMTSAQIYSAGAEAVEAGLRVIKAATGRSEILSFFNDFHGKSTGAKSLCNIDTVYGPRLAGFHRTPYGNCYRCSFKMKYPECGLHCVNYIKEVIAQETTGEIAGIVVEPLQGFGGAVVPPKGFLPGLRKLCDEYRILLMFDEVLCSFGRTGEMFAANHENVVPDIMAVGKGFGNGFPVTGILMKEDLIDNFDKISASTSYGGNPLACAAALASIEVIQEEGLVKNSAKVGKFILKKLEQMKDRHKIIGDVRGKGLFLGMELVKDKETKEPFPEAGSAVYKKAFENGVAWIPAKENLRMTPPLIMTEEVAAKALDIIEQAIYETEKEFGY